MTASGAGFEHADYVAASRAENTTRVYRTGWAQFTAWCDEHGVRGLPSGPETVACYVANLAKTAKPSTIDLHLAAISAAHRAAGYDSPTKEEAVRLVRRGVRRTLGTAQRQVRPVTVPDLRMMLQGLGTDRRGVGIGRSYCSASRARFAAASWSASTWPTLPKRPAPSWSVFERVHRRRAETCYTDAAVTVHGTEGGFLG